MKTTLFLNISTIMFQNDTSPKVNSRPIINSNARIALTAQIVEQRKDETNIITDNEKKEYFRKLIFLNL